MKRLLLKKNLLSILIVGVGLANANAQGTVQFTVNLSGANEVPPNNSSYFGSGWLDLTGTTLNYGIGVTASMPQQPTGGFIHGPAGPGMNAAVVFDLGTPILVPPFMPTDPGGWTWGGGLENLTSPQIADLMAGLWYINITTAAFPDGELRGQVVLVPEPSAIALFIMCAGSVWFVRKRTR